MQRQVQVFTLQVVLQCATEYCSEEVVYNIQSSSSVLPASPCPLQVAWVSCNAGGNNIRITNQPAGFVGQLK